MFLILLMEWKKLFRLKPWIRLLARQVLPLIEALVICILLSLLRIGIELGQAVSNLFLNLDHSKTIGIGDDSPVWVHVPEILPLFSLIILAFLLYKSVAYLSKGILKYASENIMVNLLMVLGIMKGNFIPRVTYAVGLLQLSFVAISQLLDRERTSNWEEIIVFKALVLFSVWILYLDFIRLFVHCKTI